MNTSEFNTSAVNNEGYQRLLYAVVKLSLRDLLNEKYMEDDINFYNMVLFFKSKWCDSIFEFLDADKQAFLGTVSKMQKKRPLKVEDDDKIYEQNKESSKNIMTGFPILGSSPLAI